MYDGLYHPWKKDHGPFTFYRCNNCGSGFTSPLPSPGVLEGLYETFKGGMIPRIRELRDTYPPYQWFKQCVRRAVLEREDGFSWMDIGAGGGEIALEMTKCYPLSEGWAYDYEGRPALLSEADRIHWRKTDINMLTPDNLVSADVILLITVLEHLPNPDKMLSNLVSRLRPGGRLYLTVPDYSSLASAILKKKWPYFLPGEHLAMPSVKGMERLLKEIVTEKKLDTTVEVRRISFPYSIGYYFEYFGLGTPRWFASRAVSLPTGILEASVTRK